MRRILLTTLGLAALVGLLLWGQQSSKAADHTDVLSTATAEADIADLFAWMQGGGNKVNLVLTVPAPSFADGTQYVFHVNSSMGFGMEQTETLVLCEFTGANVACWVGEPGSTAGGSGYQAYVGGDATGTEGIENEDQSLRVFAGERDDPFYFNITGFQKVVSTVIGVAGTLEFDADSCPTVEQATADALVAQLGQIDDGDDDGGALGGPPGTDAFAGMNVSALVVQVNKDLLTSGGPILSIWASTNSR